MSDNLAVTVVSPVIVERRRIRMSFTPEDHFLTLVKRNNMDS